MRHAYWVATALGELLEATPRVPEGLMRAAFRKNLRGLVDRFAAGNATAFAQGLSISYSILDGWLNGKSAASLDGLLQLSENLNIAPINLITPGSALRNVVGGSLMAPKFGACYRRHRSKCLHRH
jgi:hypothetical protein